MPDALLEVLQALKKEEEEAVRRFASWEEYRRHQDMWNPNYARTCELDPPHYGWRL